MLNAHGACHRPVPLASLPNPTTIIWEATPQSGTLQHTAPRSHNGPQCEPDPEPRDPGKSIMGKNVAENERKSHCAQKAKSLGSVAVDAAVGRLSDLTFCLRLPHGEAQVHSPRSPVCTLTTVRKRGLEPV